MTDLRCMHVTKKNRILCNEALNQDGRCSVRTFSHRQLKGVIDGPVCGAKLSEANESVCVAPCTADGQCSRNSNHVTQPLQGEIAMRVIEGYVPDQEPILGDAAQHVSTFDSQDRCTDTEACPSYLEALAAQCCTWSHTLTKNIVEVKAQIAERFHLLPQSLDNINVWGTTTVDSLLALRGLEPAASSPRQRLQKQEDEQCLASSSANAASSTCESSSSSSTGQMDSLESTEPVFHSTANTPSKAEHRPSLKDKSRRQLIFTNTESRSEMEDEVAGLLHPPVDLQNLDTRQGDELLALYIRIVSWNLKHLKLKQNSFITDLDKIGTIAQEMQWSNGHIFALQEVNSPEAIEQICTHLRTLTEEHWCSWVSTNVDPRFELAAFIWRESETCQPWFCKDDIPSDLRIKSSHSFGLVPSKEGADLYRRPVKGIFRVHGQQVELWSCHLYQTEPALEVTYLSWLVQDMTVDNLVIVGDLNHPVAKAEWRTMRKVMRPVSESPGVCTKKWYTNFAGTKETDNMWVSNMSCPEWGSKATVCSPPADILALGSYACGHGRTRGEQNAAAVYPDHRMIWADFPIAGPLVKSV